MLYIELRQTAFMNKYNNILINKSHLHNIYYMYVMDFNLLGT